jgi:hypothetical protein
MRIGGRSPPRKNTTGGDTKSSVNKHLLLMRRHHVSHRTQRSDPERGIHAAACSRAAPRRPRLPGLHVVANRVHSGTDRDQARYGAYLVAAWLGGIVVNLLSYSGYYDIALRDFGLMLGALTLARLASKFDPPGLGLRSRHEG